jgi:DNA repair exonuclease SbcCD ATPase subunit
MLQDITAELAQQPAFEAELEQAEKALAVIEGAAQKKETVLNGLRRQRDALEVAQTQLNELETHIITSQRNLQSWEEQAAQHQSKIKQYEAVIGRRTDIEHGFVQYGELKKTVDDLDQKSMLSRKLEEQKNLLDRKIEQAKNELLKNHAITESNIRQVEKKTQTLPELKTNFGQAQVQRQKLDATDENIRRQEQSAQDIQSQISRIDAENTRLEKEIAEAQEKLDMIASHIASHTEAKCPLCEQELTKEGLELITAKYTKEKQTKTNQLNQNREDIIKKKTEYESLVQEKAKLEASLNQEKNRIQNQIGALAKEISTIEEEGKKIIEFKNEITSIEEQLAKRNFALAEQIALDAIEKDLSGIKYDAEKHEQSRQQLKPLEASSVKKRYWTKPKNSSVRKKSRPREPVTKPRA